MSGRVACVAVVCMAVVAAGCGKKDTPAPTTTAEWADGVCQALVTWKDTASSAVSTIKSGSLSQDSFQQAASDLKDATDTLTSDLKSLGKPNTQAGQAAQETISTLSDELSSGADSIKTTVDGASGVTGVVKAAPEVASTLTTMGTEITTAVTDLKGLEGGQELKDAFAQSSTCQSLGGGS